MAKKGIERWFKCTILIRLLSIVAITVNFSLAWSEQELPREHERAGLRLTKFLYGFPPRPSRSIEFGDTVIPRDSNGLNAVKYRDLKTRRVNELK